MHGKGGGEGRKAAAIGANTPLHGAETWPDHAATGSVLATLPANAMSLFPARPAQLVEGQVMPTWCKGCSYRHPHTPHKHTPMLAHLVEAEVELGDGPARGARLGEGQQAHRAVDTNGAWAAEGVRQGPAVSGARVRVWTRRSAVPLHSAALMD